MELEELRKALDQIKMQEAFRPLHAPIDPESVITNLILEAKSQAVQEAAGFGALDGYCFLYTALAGYRCRQTEIDDLKGMMALLVASLRECTNDIHQSLRVAKYNLTGECVGQIMNRPASHTRLVKALEEQVHQTEDWPMECFPLEAATKESNAALAEAKALTGEEE